MSILNAEFSNFRSDFAIAIKHLEKKYELKMDLGNISYSESQFTVKLTVDSTSKKALGGAKSVNEKNWNKNAPYYGFSKDDFGKTFTKNGRTFTITGWNSRSNKYKIILTSDRGTTRANVGFVKSGLNIN